MRASSSHEPPNGGGVQGWSFKEKLVGSLKPQGQRHRVDLIKENLARFDYVEGNRLYPIFHLEDYVRERISTPWKMLWW